MIKEWGDSLGKGFWVALGRGRGFLWVGLSSLLIPFVGSFHKIFITVKGTALNGTQYRFSLLSAPPPPPGFSSHWVVVFLHDESDLGGGSNEKCVGPLCFPRATVTALSCLGPYGTPDPCITYSCSLNSALFIISPGILGDLLLNSTSC